MTVISNIHFPKVLRAKGVQTWRGYYPELCALQPDRYPSTGCARGSLGFKGSNFKAPYFSIFANLGRGSN